MKVAFSPLSLALRQIARLVVVLGALAPSPSHGTAIQLPPTLSAPPGFRCSVASRSTPQLAASARSGVATTGIQKVLVLRIRFPDDREDPVSTTEAETDLATADAWFRRMSFGSFGFTYTVSTVLPLSTPRTIYTGPNGFDRFIDDARQAGIAAGFDYRDYDLEIVRHSGVEGFAGGNARLGERGAQVQIPGAWVLMHELGHNLGLSHANFWDTSSPGFSLGSPPLPSNYPSLPDPKTIPTHPESGASHDTIIGPGTPMEYGDPWDIMGSGDEDFSAAYKEHLGWLPATASITVPPGRHTYRIHGGTHTQHPPQTFPRQLRIQGPRNGPSGARDYTVELPTLRNGLVSPSGVLVRWIDPSPGFGSSLLLDGTPASPNLNADALVPLGRTFSDRVTVVHITPIAQGIDADTTWVELVAVRGRFPSNSLPQVTLTASTLEAVPGETVMLNATALDADGDALAYDWDLSEGKTETAGSVASVNVSWSEPGDHTVRVTISDMRGGVAHAQLALRVGSPDTARVLGTVTDDLGRPVPGVRIFSGPRNPERPAGPLAQTWTDDRGAYTLTGLPPGRHTLSAFHPDHVVPRKPPVELGTNDVTEFDFTATALPRVSVQAPATVPESAGFTQLFTLHRTGPTNHALTVLFRLGGTASGSTDYVRPMLDRLVIPAGSATATLEFPILDDSVGEPSEILSLSLAETAQFTRTDASGNPFFVYFPGWEIADIDGTSYWVQTRPDYVLDSGSEAEIVILDDDAFTPHTVSITASGLIALEEPLVESFFQLSRGGAVDVPLTVSLEVSGNATPGADFEPLPTTVSFAANEDTVLIPVRPIADAVEESNEEVTLRILPHPNYGVGLASATVSIRDRLLFPQSLAIESRTDGQWQLRLRGAPGSRLVLEASEDLSQWTPIRTNLLFNTDVGSVIVPASSGARYFRTVRH